MATSPARLAWLRLYYWVTPVFFVLDWAWGVSVRASFLPSAELRFAYYGLCLGCAAVIQREPGAAPWVGLGESALNLFLLMLSILLPIWELQEAILAGAGGFAPVTGGRLMNVMLSGTMLVVAFQRSQLEVARRTGVLSRSRTR